MVLNDVIVEQIAIVASHLQSGVSHEPLKGERIAAAVYQIFPSKGVPERMNRCSLYASCVVVLHDGKPQGVLCEKVPELIAEEPVGTADLLNAMASLVYTNEYNPSNSSK